MRRFQSSMENNKLNFEQFIIFDLLINNKDSYYKLFCPNKYQKLLKL